MRENKKEERGAVSERGRIVWYSSPPDLTCAGVRNAHIASFFMTRMVCRLVEYGTAVRVAHLVSVSMV